MDTLIPISGGIYSAAVLTKWLRSHSGKVLVWNYTCGDGHDRPRSRASGLLLAALRSLYPDRIQVIENGYLPATAGGNLPLSETAAFLLRQVVSSPVASGIKKILVPERPGAEDKFGALPKKNFPAITKIHVDLRDAVQSIPVEVKFLCVCREDSIRCESDDCPECGPINAAMKPEG